MSKNIKYPIKKSENTIKHSKKNNISESDNSESDNNDSELVTKKTQNDNLSQNKKKTDKCKESDFENKMDEILEALNENYIQHKKIMNDMKELILLHKNEIKLTSKSENRIYSGKHSDFNKPEQVPLSLKKLLKIDDDILPRSKVTCLLYQYFTDNNMYNKTKKEILPNKKIKQIFDMKDSDVITCYNLQAWLKNVYKKNSP